jgi:hypothetical protein
MSAHPAHAIEIRAWRAARAQPCVARAAAEQEPGDFRVWGPAQDSLDAVLRCYRKGSGLTATSLQACLPPARLPLSPAEQRHITAMVAGMADWLVRHRPVILDIRTDLAREVPIDGTPLRVRFKARLPLTLRLEERLVVLEHRIGWRLPCPEDLATSPRTAIYSKLLERRYRQEPLWVAQWLPHTGAMTIVQVTPEDVQRQRHLVVALANALAGLRPAPEQLNAFCGTCPRRAVCSTRGAALGDQLLLL